MSDSTHGRRAERRRKRTASSGTPSGNLPQKTKAKVEFVDSENVPVVGKDRCINTPSAGWQYPSSSRCIVCGALGCTSCGVKINPEERRQKLESLKLNTPYERAKLARGTEEFICEEARQRCRLVERSEATLERIQAMELIERRLVRIAEQEDLYRRRIRKEERRMRSTCVGELDRFGVLIAASEHERQARLATIALERETFVHLARAFAFSLQLLQLAHREATTRDAIVFNEAAQRETVRARELDCRGDMAEQCMAQQHFFSTFLDSREGIVRERTAGLEHLAVVAAAHVDFIHRQMKDRVSFAHGVERALKEIRTEEAFTRRRIAEEMEEEGNYVMERQLIFARQRETLMTTEHTLRNGIVKEAMSLFHAFFLELKADEEDAARATQLRLERQEEGMQQAFQFLNEIWAEEDAVYTQIRDEEARQRALRHRWVAENQDAKRQLLSRCVEEKRAIESAESSDREHLFKSMADRQVKVAEWILHKKKEVEHFLSNSLLAVREIQSEEEDHRFRLCAAMAEEEERVGERCAQHASQLASVTLLEGNRRAALARQERECRDVLQWNFSNALDAILAVQQERMDAIAACAHDAFQGVQTLYETEESARLALLGAEQQDCCCAVEATHFRLCVALQQEESHIRSIGVQEEMSAFSHLQAKAAVAARYMAEAALQSLQTARFALCAKEDTAREMIYHEVGGGYARIAEAQRDEELQLLRSMDARIAAELASRETAMQEDSRLYNDTEELIFPTGEVVPPRPPAGISDAYAMRHALVMESLGHPTCDQPLSNAAVDMLVAVVDHVNIRRAAIQEAVATAERRARETSKKVTQQERVLASEKDKKEMYTVSSNREAEERQRRLDQEGSEKTRSLQSIHAEKKRLADVNKELQDQKKKLDALKNSISKQYGR